MSNYIQITQATVNNIVEYRVYINYEIAGIFPSYELAEQFAKKYTEEQDFIYVLKEGDESLPFYLKKLK